MVLKIHSIKNLKRDAVKEIVNENLKQSIIHCSQKISYGGICYIKILILRRIKSRKPNILNHVLFRNGMEIE